MPDKDHYVTADECQEAVKELGLTFASHHACSICMEMVGYHFSQDSIAFDPSCDCGGRGLPRQTTWPDFANNFNMQATPEMRAVMWKRFKAGLPTHGSEED